MAPRVLDYADIQHSSSMVAALTQTRTLMEQVDSVVIGQLWPAASPP